MAAGEQDHECLPALNKIDSVSRTIVYTQLRDAFPHWFHVAGIAQGQTADSRIDACSRLPIPQALEPFGIFIGLPDFYHTLRVSFRIQKGKRNLKIIEGTHPLWPGGLTFSISGGGESPRPTACGC